jgi:hypothetical protein
MSRPITSLRRRAPRRAVRAALVAALVVVPATAPVLTARAEAGGGYPGGCAIAYAAAPPSSCTYVSVGGAPVHVAFEGSGTVSVSGCTGGDLSPSPPGTYVTSGQVAGCTYTLAISGTGIAVAVNEQVADFGVCSDFSDGFILGDSADCFYDAVTTGGEAVGEAISSLPAEVDIVVKDTSNGGTVASCRATGTGSIDVTCPFPETFGHEYEVSASDPTFNDLLLAVVAEG